MYRPFSRTTLTFIEILVHLKNVPFRFYLFLRKSYTITHVTFVLNELFDNTNV